MSNALAAEKLQYNITGGTRPGGGANLFHSFGEFGCSHPITFAQLPAMRLACHSNILARVTGAILSNIFGTIKQPVRERESLCDEPGRVLVWAECD